MGMFDYVRCDFPLPDGFDPPDDQCLQSKDGPCELKQLWITAGGRLVLVDTEQGEVRDEFWSGEFLFYGGSRYLTRSYLANFLGGQLIKITDLNHKPDDESD